MQTGHYHCRVFLNQILRLFKILIVLEGQLATLKYGLFKYLVGKNIVDELENNVPMTAKTL